MIDTNDLPEKVQEQNLQIRPDEDKINILTVDPSQSFGQSQSRQEQIEMAVNSRIEKVMILPKPSLLIKELAISRSDQHKSSTGPKRKSLQELGFYPPPDSKCVGPSAEKRPVVSLVVDMLRRGKCPDIMVRIGSKRYPCHMCVLQTYSEIFRRLTIGEETVIRDSLIRDKIFEFIYRWMLMDSCLIPYKKLVELFHASQILQIPELTKMGWSYFDCAVEIIKEDQAFALCLQAKKYKLWDIQEALLRRISKFFLALVASEDYLKMDDKEVVSLLSGNNIGVNSEVEVFLSALRWLNHDRNGREEHLEKLMNCIRFEAMPAWYLLQIQNKSISTDIDWIADKQFVINMIKRAMIYSVANQHYAGKKENFLQWLTDEGVERIAERQYIFDKGCLYHHRMNCPHMHLITYKMFQNYLNEIALMGRDHWRCIEHDVPNVPCTCIKKSKFPKF